MKTITWKSKTVAVSKIKPTPQNYKIKNALGQERLKMSLAKFGLAGTVVCNTDYTLIDGNSRLEQEKAKGRKNIEVSVPNRKLSPQEFKEMSAMFDFAKAGEVDLERIQGDLGTKADFYKNWNLQVPMHLLEKLGNKASIGKPNSKTNGTALEYPEEGETEAIVSDSRMVQLFFNVKQEEEFRKIEEKLKKRFKTNNTTDTVLKAFKSFK